MPIISTLQLLDRSGEHPVSDEASSSLVLSAGWRKDAAALCRQWCGRWVWRPGISAGRGGKEGNVHSAATSDLNTIWPYNLTHIPFDSDASCISIHLLLLYGWDGYNNIWWDIWGRIDCDWKWLERPTFWPKPRSQTSADGINKSSKALESA